MAKRSRSKVESLKKWRMKGEKEKRVIRTSTRRAKMKREKKVKGL